MKPDLHRRDRRGASLAVVLLFLTVLFSMWAAVHRGTASLIQTQTAMTKRDDLDGGAINALAQRLWDLENDSSDKGSKTYSAGGRSYAVTMKPGTGNQWVIHVSPVPQP
jgi:hypothetical protein